MIECLILGSRILALAFFLAGCLFRPNSKGADYFFILESGKITARIEKKYHDHWRELTPARRGQLSLLLYRTSGDKKYLSEVNAYAAKLRKYFTHHAANLDHSDYVEARSREIFENDAVTPKETKRRELLKGNPEMLFRLHLLYLADQLKIFGFDQDPAIQKDFARILAYLKDSGFQEFLLNPEVVKYKSAAAVNAVYELQDLGLMDLEAEFIELAKQVFTAADQPGAISSVEYENRIDGLTHLMIADSRHYQRFVSEEKWRWVLDYLSDHLSEIAARSQPDIIAEAGICFKLVGYKNHPVIVLTQTYVMRSFDPALNLIPSAPGVADLNRSEHRNAMALILLNDFDAFYPGPKIFIEKRL